MKKPLITLSLATSIILFSGCSTKKETTLEFVQQKQKDNLYENYKGDQVKIKLDYVNLSTDKSITSMLNDLSKITGKYYSFRGTNITILGVPGFKAKTFEEINNFVRTMTTKELVITKNRLDENLPKVVELIDQEPDTKLDQVIIDSDNLINPASLFKDLAKITGYRIMENEESTKILNQTQKVWFKGTYREFIKSFADLNNMYIDINTKNNTVRYTTYKIKRLKLKVSNETQEYKSTIEVDLSDTEGTDQNSKTTLISKSNYKAIESLNSFLTSLFPEIDNSFYGKLIEATNEVLIKADPVRMELVENFIQNINNDALKQVNFKVTVMEVNLQDQFNAGINWSYVKNITNTLGETTKTITGGINGIVPALDNSLSSPTILKVSQESGAGGMLNLLKQFGDTSIITSIPLITTNELPALVNLAKKKSYIEDWDLTTEGDVTYLAPNQNHENYGTYAYLKPSIYDNEVRITFKMIDSPMPNFNKEIFDDGRYLQTVDTDKKIFSQNFIMKPGEKILIGGFLRTLKNKDYEGSSPDQDSMIAPLLGVKGKNTITQELVLQIELAEF